MQMIERIFNPVKFTGYHMWGVMILFFGTIISVNLTLAWYANSTWTGLVVKNSYVASQKFNEQTKVLKGQAEMGWKVEPKFAANAFSLNLTDANGARIDNAVITAMVGLPARENADRLVQFVQDQQGVYRAPVDLDNGYWEAKVAIIGPKADQWNKSYRFVIKNEQ